MPTFKIAIVGAGPTGYFAAQALQNLADDNRVFEIDMIERLPTPWGLVRSGVAPDHPKIKTVSKVFEMIASQESFRLFANVEIGSDISVAQLQEKYDAVIVATGSSHGKTLGIPGENLRGSLSAATFVPWYNAHPDFVGVDTPLDADTAVVIGAGNVAMDVARMLALEPSELDPTDTADHAIEAFKKSNIRKVYISARRGPEHAAFTSPELRELPKLEHTNVIMDKGDIDASFTFPASIEGNYRQSSEMGGGALFDIGVYPLHAIAALVGDGAKVEIEKCEVNAGPTDIDLTTTWQMRINDLITATGLASFEMPEKQSLVVSGEKKTITFVGDQAFTSWHSPSTLQIGDLYEEFEADNPYMLMIENFGKKIQGQDSWVLPLETSLWVQKVVDTLRKH